VLFLPIGGGPTIGGESAAALIHQLRPRLVLPMHYRTAAVNFLEPPDAFLAAVASPVTHVETNEAEVDGLLGATGEPTIALLVPPAP
jgi:L-ascorbate metabolism protein UlaG (beta-lactamase superfamily)